MTAMTESVPTPAAEISADLVKRGAIATPAFLLLGVFWGVDGVISAGLGIALVVVNWVFTTYLIRWAARISAVTVAAAMLFGYLARMIVLLAAMVALKGQPWLEPIPFAVTILVAYLGLLVLEVPRISGSVAFPGLKPAPPVRAAHVPSTDRSAHAD